MCRHRALFSRLARPCSARPAGGGGGAPAAPPPCAILPLGATPWRWRLQVAGACLAFLPCDSLHKTARRLERSPLLSTLPVVHLPGKRLAVAVWGAHLSASHGLGLWASTWRQPSVQGVGKGQGGLSCRLWPFGSAAGRIPARVQRAWRASPGSAPCLCCPGSHQCAAGACEPAFSARGHAAVKGSRPNKFSDISRTPD